MATWRCWVLDSELTSSRYVFFCLLCDCCHSCVWCVCHLANTSLISDLCNTHTHTIYLLMCVCPACDTTLCNLTSDVWAVVVVDVTVGAWGWSSEVPDLCGRRTSSSIVWTRSLWSGGIWQVTVTSPHDWHGEYCCWSQQLDDRHVSWVLCSDALLETVP